MYPKEMMRSEPHLISIFKWKMKKKNTLETLDMLGMEDNTKSVNGTKVKENRASRRSTRANATVEEGPREGSCY